MGELLAHFKGWDVQAARREGREEVWEEAQKEVREAREEVLEVRKEMLAAREESVMKSIRIIKKLGCTEETAKQQLIDEYELNREEAAKKVGMYWRS